MSSRRAVLGILGRNRFGALSAIIIALLVVSGLLGLSLLGSDGPNALSDMTLAPPSAAHIFGTDEVGRDVFTLIIYGVRSTLVVGAVAALLASLFGVVIGASAGFFGRWIDAVMMRVSEIFQSIPTFILAAVVVAMAGPGILRVISVIAALSWPQPARIMRGEVLRVKQMGFVDSVRCLGMHEQRILWLEVVPNALTPVIALGTMLVGQAILLESALSFFGLTPPDVPSWGLLLNSGQKFFYQAWWLSVFPGAFILGTVLSFNFLGDAVQKELAPQNRAMSK